MAMSPRRERMHLIFAGLIGGGGGAAVLAAEPREPVSVAVGAVLLSIGGVALLMALSSLSRGSVDTAASLMYDAGVRAERSRAQRKADRQTGDWPRAPRPGGCWLMDVLASVLWVFSGVNAAGSRAGWWTVNLPVHNLIVAATAALTVAAILTRIVGPLYYQEGYRRGVRDGVDSEDRVVLLNRPDTREDPSSVLPHVGKTSPKRGG